jgi:beta-phosphoglucomutase-like phosphatase (HAD superfamily)
LERIEAVTFDFDGLLVDTENLHVLAYDAVAEYLGIHLTREYINSFIGKSTRENIQQIMGDFHISQHSYNDILKLRYDTYHDIIKSTPLSLMAGAMECIKKVQKNNYKKALVTSSMDKHAITAIENIRENHRGAGNNNGIDLMNYFDAMVFGNEIANLKPEPDIYIEALKRIDVAPDRCIALEDSEAGVESAKKAGLYVIAVPNEHTCKQDFHLADKKASSLNEVARMEFFN